ncbi:large ribosomal subunit protein uL24z-like [Magnolia sinica]|uniref:large ribosomal subunit protein uL24z-like n=1 Tax=Magnolia sinica TaxID=86752 RepID=UPI0026587FFD|nr:large ribosomal subunit protein uL24z-like [Magnolia sinica]
MRIKMFDRVEHTLTNVRHVLDLKQNLISLSVLEEKGYKYTCIDGALKAQGVIHVERISSSCRKCKKAHFTTPSSMRRVLMSTPFSSNLWNKYTARSVPVCKDDKVRVVSGTYKGCEGKVVQVYCRKWVIHVECIRREKVNGSIVNVDIHPSKVIIKKLKIDKDRKALLDGKAKGCVVDKAKGKFTAEEVFAAIGSGPSLQEVD